MSALGSITPEQEGELLQGIRASLSVQTSDKISVRPVEFLKKYNITTDLTEREMKILEIDVGEVLKEIHEHHPRLIFHGEIEDTRYDFPPGHAQIEETMRIRRKNDSYVLTIKKKNTSKKIKEREEFEVPLSNVKAFEEIFTAMSLVPVHVKEKIRYSYEIESITVDLDLYYVMPALLEIEGANEEIIRDRIKKFNLDKHKIVNWSARQTLAYYGQR